MGQEIEIRGQRIPFDLRSDSLDLKPTTVLQVGTLIAERVLEVLHYPLTATVRGIAVTISRAATEITVLLQDQRAERRIALQYVTARRFSEFLVLLEGDLDWDRRVKEKLTASLLSSLDSELQRLR